MPEERLTTVAQLWAEIRVTVPTAELPPKMPPGLTDRLTPKLPAGITTTAPLCVAPSVAIMLTGVSEVKVEVVI